MLQKQVQWRAAPPIWFVNVGSVSMQETADGGSIVQSNKMERSLLLSTTGTIDEFGTEGKEGV
jgi:hypothetical protein